MTKVVRRSIDDTIKRVSSLPITATQWMVVLEPIAYLVGAALAVALGMQPVHAIVLALGLNLVRRIEIRRPPSRP